MFPRLRLNGKEVAEIDISRGQGLSDRISGAPSFEQRMDDVYQEKCATGRAQPILSRCSSNIPGKERGTKLQIRGKNG
jgi:hypothetical protein